jgi:putative ABC transport system ATP-binding protein
MHAFKTQDLSLTYTLDGNKFTALSKINLNLLEGEFVCLSGPSGSGKSTLLNVLGLIEPKFEGSVSFFNQAIEGMKAAEQTKLRLFDVGFIFQSFHLFPTLTVEENVSYFVSLQGKSASECKAISEEMIHIVGLSEHKHKRPHQLSGGQRQRVSIARAFAKQPKVIIADEPTASLDSKTGKSVLEKMKELNKKFNTTVVIASHDGMVMKFCERNICLKDGSLSEGEYGG